MTDHFEALATALGVGPVTKPASLTQPQRMNVNSFCIRNRVFAMRVGDDLVLKLPPPRVAELVDSGAAAPNIVGKTVMKEWANFRPGTEERWAELARESLDYVRDKR